MIITNQVQVLLLTAKMNGVGNDRTEEKREKEGDKGEGRRENKSEEPAIIGHKNARGSPGSMRGNAGLIPSLRVRFCYILISLCLSLVQSYAECQDACDCKAVSQVLENISRHMCIRESPSLSPLCFSFLHHAEKKSFSIAVSL